MKTVFVALSGGVDSAVTAHILQAYGWNVTGVFIRVWQPDFIKCNQDEEERAAKRVAASLGIPFRRLDLSKEYKKEVVDKMVAEYKAGRTPNPDVLCNATIKFGAFLYYAKKQGTDKIATGHHAQILQLSAPSAKLDDEDVNVQYALARGVDTGKDQAYFLWKLTQEQLSYTLMPIGSMQKTEVREYAQENDIPSANKPDSQGLCFIGHVDMKIFLSHFITPTPGNVLNEAGEIIGTHEGTEYLTIGQRSGFILTTKDENREVQYIVAKDIENKTITVSKIKLSARSTKLGYILTDTNFSQPIQEKKEYTAEIRYHGKIYACTLSDIKSTTALITFIEPLLIAKGQSVVVYDKNICIGGGVL